MKRAIGYVRVSTEQQAAEGVSLDMQAAKIRSYCELYGYELAEIIVDAGASASTLNREGLTRALSALESGEVVALVVFKLDRLTRSVRDLDTLLNGYFAGDDKALVSVNEQVDTATATGRMILNILMSVAQWERETIGERIRDAMRHKKAKGEFCGGLVPYGCRVDDDGKTLIEDDAEQAVIEAVRHYRADGLKLRQIVDELNRQGFKTRTGNVINISFVHRLTEAA